MAAVRCLFCKWPRGRSRDLFFKKALARLAPKFAVQISHRGKSGLPEATVPGNARPG